MGEKRRGEREKEKEKLTLYIYSPAVDSIPISILPPGKHKHKTNIDLIEQNWSITKTPYHQESNTFKNLKISMLVQRTYGLPHYRNFEIFEGVAFLAVGGFIEWVFLIHVCILCLSMSTYEIFEIFADDAAAIVANPESTTGLGVSTCEETSFYTRSTTEPGERPEEEEKIQHEKRASEREKDAELESGRRNNGHGLGASYISVLMGVQRDAAEDEEEGGAHGMANNQNNNNGGGNNNDDDENDNEKSKKGRSSAESTFGKTFHSFTLSALLSIPAGLWFLFVLYAMYGKSYIKLVPLVTFVLVSVLTTLFALSVSVSVSVSPQASLVVSMTTFHSSTRQTRT